MPSHHPIRSQARRDVYDALVLLSRDNHLPSLRQIADHLGVHFTGVRQHLVALLADGFVRRVPRDAVRDAYLPAELPTTCPTCGQELDP